MNRTDIPASQRRSAVDKIVILREIPYLDRRRIQRASKNGQEIGRGFIRQTQKLHWAYCRMHPQRANCPITHIFSLKTAHSPVKSARTVPPDICYVAGEPEEPIVFARNFSSDS